MLPIGAIQTAIFEALTAALAPVPVLDLAGPNQPYPYLTIGEFIGAPADTLNEQGVDHELTVHVWSRQPGMQECAELMEVAKNALDRHRLIIEGFQWVDTVWTQAQTMRDPDGKTRH